MMSERVSRADKRYRDVSLPCMIPTTLHSRPSPSFFPFGFAPRKSYQHVYCSISSAKTRRNVLQSSSCPYIHAWPFSHDASPNRPQSRILKLPTIFIHHSSTSLRSSSPPSADRFTLIPSTKSAFFRLPCSVPSCQHRQSATAIHTVSGESSSWPSRGAPDGS